MTNTHIVGFSNGVIDIYETRNEARILSFVDNDI